MIETVVRTLTVMGIVLACAAYLLFVTTGSIWTALALAIGGVIGSIAGLIVWQRDQQRRR